MEGSGGWRLEDTRALPFIAAGDGDAARLGKGTEVEGDGPCETAREKGDLIFEDVEFAGPWGNAASTADAIGITEARGGQERGASGLKCGIEAGEDGLSGINAARKFGKGRAVLGEGHRAGFCALSEMCDMARFGLFRKANTQGNTAQICGEFDSVDHGSDGAVHLGGVEQVLFGNPKIQAGRREFDAAESGQQVAARGTIEFAWAHGGHGGRKLDVAKAGAGDEVEGLARIAGDQGSQSGSKRESKITHGERFDTKGVKNLNRRGHERV